MYIGIHQNLGRGNNTCIYIRNSPNSYKGAAPSGLFQACSLNFKLYNIELEPVILKLLHMITTSVSTLVVRVQCIIGQQVI